VRKRLRVWVSAVGVAIVAQVAHAATFTVDSTADKVDAKPGDGKCATDVGTCTLRAAIQEANEQGGGTINLNPGTYTLSIKPDGALPLAATGDLDIYGALTISGGGADKTIVDGGGIDRVFAVQVASRVTLSDLTVRNGKSLPGDDGGGIWNYGDLTLENVTITGNSTRTDATLTADAPGGGIFNAATLQIRNCTITGNSAADMGGGIHNKGIMTVLQSTIANNTAAADRGGGVNNFNQATIILSTVSGNQATSSGGGIENGGKLILTHSTVSGNTGQDGGGIHNVGSLHMTDATVTGNTAHQHGGGISNDFSSDALKGSLKLNGVTVAGNSAGDKNEGAPAGGGIANHKPSATTIANSIVAGNRDVGGKAPDCVGKLLSAGYNLIQSPDGCKVRGTLTGVITGKDPKLGPLAKNGGPTQTMALLAGSPAIDAGNPAKPGGGSGACEVTDQRGQPRGVNGAGQTVCDLGAFEYSK
jgi:CSLREA domain-containing protein